MRRSMRFSRALRIAALGLLASVAPLRAEGPEVPAVDPRKLEIPADTDPLPEALAATADEAVAMLAGLVGASPEQARTACWLGMLKQPGTDDRVIPWTRVCPAEGASAEICAQTSVGAATLAGIAAPAQVEGANAAIEGRRFIVYLRSDVLRTQVYSPPVVDDSANVAAVLAHLEALAKDAARADRELAARSASGAPWAGLAAWVDARKRDPKSVYRCLAAPPG